MSANKTNTAVKEPVRIRFKELRNGNKSIYLDTYVKGRRKYDFLKLYLIPEKDQTSKTQNAATIAAAIAIKSQKIIEITNNIARGITGKHTTIITLNQWSNVYLAKEQELVSYGTIQNIIGRNTLLITPQYGSLVWLGGILTEMEISPDPILENICTNCQNCVSACPVGALDGELMDQMACHNHAFGQMDGNFTISCHLCRDVCPFCLSGVK